jgi:hypothetical protein
MMTFCRKSSGLKMAETWATQPFIESLQPRTELVQPRVVSLQPFTEFD